MEESTEQNDIDLEKQQKLEKEKKEFLRKVLSGNLETMHEKVGFLLNTYSYTRNSDIELAWRYWRNFEAKIFNGQCITKKNLFDLTRINSISRSRARIQNEYQLFQADDIIKKQRGMLAEKNKQESIEQKPNNLPMYTIHIDETGKTQQYLSVGSLWVVDGYQSFVAGRKLKSWKEKLDIKYEFHFSEVSKHKLENYKLFFQKYLELNPTIGFKSIIIEKTGIQNINKAITDLTFHIINKGINHENETGRSPLPRLLQVWLDDEEKGSDQLKIENIKERLTSQNIEGLYLGDFTAIDSRESFEIQIVDLFTASINRKIHFPNGENFKDKLADFILELLEFDISNIDLYNNNPDKSKIFNLTYKS